jgi:peptide/nickel transport system permease protein
VARRLAIFAASLLAASAFVFFVLAVLPGDTAQVILGTDATPASLARLRAEMGLDQPVYLRYLQWLFGLVRGDFGMSRLTLTPVWSEILSRLWISGPLALLAMFFSLAFSIPLGVVAAARHKGALDAAISGASQLGIAVPAFWAGIMLSTIFAARLRWFPSGGFVPWGDDPLQALRSLLLPALTLGLVQGAILTRYVRGAVLEVMREDYIRTARAKGLTRTSALLRHGLRNAAIPVVTILGLQLSYLLVGAVVIENVFFLPGLGRMLFQAIGQRDLVLVQGTVMFLTAVVLLVNFLVDLSYHALDPRLRADA